MSLYVTTKLLIFQKAMCYIANNYSIKKIELKGRKKQHINILDFKN